MTVVAAYHYRDGIRLAAVAMGEAKPLPQESGDFVWIGLHDPTPQEFDQVQQRFHLHPLAVEDAGRSHQLPKLDVYGEQLFVLVRTARREGDRIAYGEASLFVGRNHIITVRHGPDRGFKTLRSQLEEAPGLLKLGVDYVLHGVLDHVVDDYLPIVESIEDEVLGMERRALDAFLSRDEIARIFTLRRELVHFQRVLGPTGELCAKLVHLDLPCIDAESKPYFQDVLDHVRRVQTRIEALLATLGSVFEVANLLEQQRQGAITRQLAAWAAILAVPTAIAGIYGMNFRHMPELDTRYGYFVVLGVIVALCAILYWRFRRTGWL